MLNKSCLNEEYRSKTEKNVNYARENVHLLLEQNKKTVKLLEKHEYAEQSPDTNFAPAGDTKFLFLLPQTHVNQLIVLTIQKLRNLILLQTKKINSSKKTGNIT